MNRIYIFQPHIAKESASQEVDAFTRLSTGRLELLQYLPFYKMPHLRPLSVMLWNPARPWQKRAKPRVPQSGVNEGIYVNHAAPFHQYTWGFGDMRSHCYTVKEGTARACTLQAVNIVAVFPLHQALPASQLCGSKTRTSLRPC